MNDSRVITLFMASEVHLYSTFDKIRFYLQNEHSDYVPERLCRGMKYPAKVALFDTKAAKSSHNGCFGDQEHLSSPLEEMFRGL